MTTVSDPATPTTAEAPRGRGILKAVRRLGWGVADQGMSSVSNFALGLFVARSFGADNFGAFTLAFVTYTVVINATRGLATDPFLVRHSGAQDERWRRAAGEATGAALLVGLVVGVVCVVLGLAIAGPVGPVLVALGVGLPGLALQDSFRFTFFACGRGSAAFVNDLVWTVLMVLALAVLYVREDGSAARCLLAFGATATIAALLGMLQARVLPRPTAALSWLRTHRDLSVRYLVENVSSSGSSQLRSLILGAVAGLAAVGYVRASEILMGPFLVLLMGVSQVAVPEASRVFHRNHRHLIRFCAALGGGQAVAAIAWGVVLMTVFPLGPGEFVLKELWAPTRSLLPAIILTVAAASFITAATAGLRAMGVARRSMPVQVTASIAYVVGGSVGAVLGGALGASWGVAIAQIFSALLWWHQLRSALHHHDANQAVTR